MTDHDINAELEAVSELLDTDTNAASATDALSPAAQAFLASALDLRERARLENQGPTPDVSAQISRRLAPRQSPRREPRVGWRLAAPVFAMAAIIGSVLAGFPNQGADTAFADLANEMIVAQGNLDEFHARISLTEYGWDNSVPVRSYTGGLSFESPEQLRLELDDLTDYPNQSWQPNDRALGIDNGDTWSVGRPSCPLDLRSTCRAGSLVEQRTIGQAPFRSAVSALDLVIPVGAVISGDSSVDLFDGTSMNRTADTLTVTGPPARFASLLSSLFGDGDWRLFAPVDQVRVVVDSQTFVLQELSIRAGDDPSRSRWALRTGYFDAPGALLLEMSLDPAPEADLGETFATKPPGATMNAGFLDLAIEELPLTHPRPAGLPDGLSHWRSGTAGDTSVSSWTDGRAWLTIRSTSSWTADRLFGEFDAFVQTFETDAGTVVHLSPDGLRVGLHGTIDGQPVEVEVAGTLGSTALIAVAESLPMDSTSLPDSWLQARTVAAIPDTILRPRRFSASRIDGETVTILAAGPGRSGFQLIAEPGATIGPPQNPDVEAIAIRATQGRFTPDRQSVEWIEDGVRYELVGEGLTVVQLVAAAGDLQ